MEKIIDLYGLGVFKEQIKNKIGISYDNVNKRINIKFGTEIIDFIDASMFLVDGMLEDVNIVNQDDKGHTGTYIMFVFNTGASSKIIYLDAGEILKDIPFSTYDEILFVSKSIGTAISARFNEEHHVNAYSIYFTPLAATFKYSLNGIAFHGTNDPWAKTNLIQCACDEAHIPLILYRDANHSLECGDVLVDISNLHDIFLHVIEAIQTVYPL